MFRRSTNNPWIPPGGINAGTFAQIGGEDVAPVLAQAGNGRFSGQLGQTVVHSKATALQSSKLSVGTLFEGVYQIVRFSSGVTNVTRGQIAAWDTNANNGIQNFLVTNAPTAATPKAGIILFTENSVGGKYAYIQVAGLASILFGGTLGAAGSLAIQGTTADTPSLTAATATTFLDGTAIPATGGTFMKSILGQTYETALTNSAVNRVIMSPTNFYVNIG